MSRRNDRGSATFWVIAAITLVLAVTAVGIARTQAVLARHRAESAADLSALAGATGIGRSDPCQLAIRVARANRDALTGCTPRLAPDGRSGSVWVRVGSLVPWPLVGGGRVYATARAARDPVP